MTSQANNPIRAVQYLRMSKEHQRYSLENQAAVIADYALAQGYEISRTYTDAGKSGLHLKGRTGLQQLL
jgi:DNA invertase Pin-like site-specific DNA recombinase